MLRVKISRANPRTLDFDIENRPLAYLGADFTSGEVTAIAWSWVGEDTVHAALLGETPGTEMLLRFRAAYEKADIVTGHYIRRHDLPVVNGALMEHNLPPLTPKWTSDTKLDLVKRRYISASQESLGAMLQIEAPKVHMTQSDWRSGNRLEPEGLEKTRARVTQDVIQHKALRAELIRRGLLGPPRLWRP